MQKGLMMLLALAGTCAPMLAQADSRQDVVNQLARCAVLTDDRQWLECYYGAAQPMRAQLGLSPAPQANMDVLKASAIPTRVAPAAGVAAAPVLAAPAPARSGPPPMPRRSGLLDFWGGDAVVANAPVKDYDLGGSGFTVTLADGQVWQQTPEDAAAHPASWRDPASSMHVTINQGAMHTFNLVMNDENVQHKVRRIH